MTQGSNNQLINMRKRIAIIRTHLIEIGIVNIHPPISIRYFNEYNVGEPLRILHLDNNPYS